MTENAVESPLLITLNLYREAVRRHQKVYLYDHSQPAGPDLGWDQMVKWASEADQEFVERIKQLQLKVDEAQANDLSYRTEAVDQNRQIAELTARLRVSEERADKYRQDFIGTLGRDENFQNIQIEHLKAQLEVRTQLLMRMARAGEAMAELVNYDPKNNKADVVRQWRKIVYEEWGKINAGQIGIYRDWLSKSIRLIERLLILVGSLRRIGTHGSAAWVMCNEEYKKLDAEYRAFMCEVK